MLAVAPPSLVPITVKGEPRTSFCAFGIGATLDDLEQGLQFLVHTEVEEGIDRALATMPAFSDECLIDAAGAVVADRLEQRPLLVVAVASPPRGSRGCGPLHAHEHPAPILVGDIEVLLHDPDLCKRLPPIASTGGAARRENWEDADMAQSLRHSRRVEGFRDAASEDSGCEVALQVLGSLPLTSSRPFIGEPR
jgi:hypothetical protein